MTTKTMTTQEALRGDSCSFPTYTLALHKRAANHIDELERQLSDAEERAAQYEQELAASCDREEKLLRLLPNSQDAFEITKGIFHSEEGQ